MAHDTDEAALASAGLILFNAMSCHELISLPNKLKPIRIRVDNIGTWKGALREAFEDAYAINYEAIFLYALRILDLLPSSPVLESTLEKIYEVSEYIISRSGLLKHDLAGRIYHSALGRNLAKAFATFYSSIPASELLAWIAVENWDDSVADFACGSGTLLLAAYHKKLSTAFLDPVNAKTDVNTLHRSFIEEQIIGLDAMPFAAHLTLVNLAMQQPSAIFKQSKIFHVPVGTGAITGERTVGSRLGSLDILRNNVNSIFVQRRMNGEEISASRKNLKLKTKRSQFEIANESIDVVIMNPPFTKKQRVSSIIDKNELKKVVKQVGPQYTSAGGLPLPFVLLGDKYLAENGRLALIVPTTVLDRSTWEAIRDLFLDKYEVEHIILSWAAGKPAFSENSTIRETLIIARKIQGEKGSDLKRNTFTLITHLDTDFSFIEARQIAEQLVMARSHPLTISIESQNQQAIYHKNKYIGESIAFPKTLMESTSDNWYRLMSFRNTHLVKSALIQQRYLASQTPPYNFNFSRYLSSIANTGIAEVGLFIKQVSSAGFKELENKPKSGGIPCIMTSDYSFLSTTPNSLHYLVKDGHSNATESFNPGLGHLLVPRKLNVLNTAKVLSIVSDEKISGNMWIPIDPKPIITKDGETLSPIEVSKIIGLWVQSSFGVHLLLSSRHEIEGAWSEWVTDDIRKIPLLNPACLNKDQVFEIISCWENLKNYRWELLHEQFNTAINSSNHPRRIIDETLLKTILNIESEPLLDKFYFDLENELKLLGRVMTGHKRRPDDDLIKSKTEKINYRVQQDIFKWI